MKGLAIVSKGIENIASQEIKELIGAKSRMEEGCVMFDIKSLNDLCLLCYKSQSIDRAVYSIGSFTFSDFFNEFENFIKKTDFGGWLAKLKKFRVECIRAGSHDFKSTDVEKKCADFIKKHKSGFDFDSVSYKIIFLVYIINDKCYFGVDFSGFELNKRNYKVYLHPNSCRGTVAYALLRKSKFKRSETMLDPFSRDGVIPIEAALYALNFPCNHYKKDKFAFLRLNIGIDFAKFYSNIDKKIKKSKTKICSYDHLFKYVDYSRKNAKIAGIEKQINFSRVDLEWLDIKFKKGSIDKIITRLPESKSTNKNKIYNEFFYQSEYILKANGSIALISKMPEIIKQHASKHNFIIVSEETIWSGSDQLNMMLLKKKSI